MRIAQIVLPDATAYERKCQRVDAAALSPAHEVFLSSPEETLTADVAHVYAGTELPARAFRRFALPYVASADVPRSRWPWNRAVAPGYVVSPLTEKVEQSRVQPLPEAVEDWWFGPSLSSERELKTIGTFGSKRPGVRNAVEQTLARIHRFRSDVTWTFFDEIPTRGSLSGVDVWVDPANADNDLDGFVAEALVAGLPVVATRTKINTLRLEQGRSGFLVPPNDPNEMTHAILAALFKPEVASNKVHAARQTISRYKARQRLRILLHLYETLIP